MVHGEVHHGPPRFCRRHLPSELVGGRAQELGESLVRAFHRLDERLWEPSVLEELRTLSHGAFKSWANPEIMGCTAVCALVRPDAIWVANAGDSRAVLCRRGKAIDMCGAQLLESAAGARSEDHKPNNKLELARIVKAATSYLINYIGHLYGRLEGPCSNSTWGTTSITAREPFEP